MKATHAPLADTQALLFDLDGTFADTAPDLAYALNETLRAFNRDPLAYEAIRPVVSHGGNALIQLGFGMQPGESGFEMRRQHLLTVYKQNICRHTRLFDGMAEVISTLEQHGMPWGIVTNKPGWLTDPLMEAMQLTQRAGAIVSGDTCENRKPHPEPIIFACQQIGVEPEATTYVGDAGRDIEAGRAAGTATVAALFGYLCAHDDPNDWLADHRITHAAQLLDLMGLRPDST